MQKNIQLNFNTIRASWKHILIALLIVYAVLHGVHKQATLLYHTIRRLDKSPNLTAYETNIRNTAAPLPAQAQCGFIASSNLSYPSLSASNIVIIPSGFNMIYAQYVLSPWIVFEGIHSNDDFVLERISNETKQSVSLLSYNTNFELISQGNNSCYLFKRKQK